MTLTHYKSREKFMPFRTPFVLVAVLLMATGVRAATTQPIVNDFGCWQMLPVTETRAKSFQDQVASLPKSTWANFYKLYLASTGQDRAGMLAVADAVGPFDEFPTVRAEAAKLAELRSQNVPDVQAGLAVIRARSYGPLHALQDLDRSLSREIEFLHGAGDDAGATKLESCRQRLRGSYLKSSRHLVERLFALNLLERKDEAAALRNAASSIAYLSDPNALATTLNQLGQKRAWDLVVKPLLESEVALVNAPPALDKVAPPATEMEVTAATKSNLATTTTFEGNVRVGLETYVITCDRLVVMRDGNFAQLTGNGRVTVKGLATVAETLTSDALTFSTESGAFSFTGDIRAGKLKLRACMVGRDGVITDKRSLLDDFAGEKLIEERLKLAKVIASIYDDAEMPADVRYMAAMSLIRPHLSWQAPYAAAEGQRQLKQLDRVRHADDPRDDGRWLPANTGETWMHAEARASLTTRPATQKLVDAPEKDDEKPFWRLDDPSHRDIARAIKLLESIGDGDPKHSAHRWAADLKRNNTVLTMDILGGYSATHDGPLVIDARSAEKITFKLYRVQNAAELLAVADRIGDDFMYRDYGLQSEQHVQMEAQAQQELARLDRLERSARPDLPKWQEKDLVTRWDAQISELPVLSDDLRWVRDAHGSDDDFSDDEEAEYYDDACAHYRDRIEYRYRRNDGRASSWQTDRIVTIPAKMLAKPGAYVLVAESNGQSACAPILVDPLSLTLRRCRDGVFALVSDSAGQEPVDGATITAREALTPAVTDKAGAAFARIYAGGDRAIIAEKDGRYAIGGFGDLFEGIYVSPFSRMFAMDIGRQMLQRAAEVDRSAQVYADRCVVAAYTDRPTYRPGQDVQFKMIVRKLLDRAAATNPSDTPFREEDFNFASNLGLYAVDTECNYSVIDPRGRRVADGQLKLNDFGTAAGKLTLNTESQTGLYTLRVNINGAERIVPSVFSVKFYRRPNFEVKLDGIPRTITDKKELKLSVQSAYYFGKPVAGGKFDVRLMRKESWKPVQTLEGQMLDARGVANAVVPIPTTLEDGEYVLICSVTDDSGRTASASAATNVALPVKNVRGTGLLSAIPRFIAVDESLEIKTGGEKVTAEQIREGKSIIVTFEVQVDTVTAQFHRPGWYSLKAGKEISRIFVYGGKEHFNATGDPEKEDEGPQWVNLTAYAGEDNNGADSFFTNNRFDDPEQNLWALFDAQHARAGDALRVLVYCPCDAPRLLFTMEGRTVVDYAVIRPKAGAGHYRVVQIPIIARHAPNFYLQGRILNPSEQLDAHAVQRADRARLAQEAKKLEDLQGEDPRWCRIDVADPQAVASGEKLHVDVKVDRADHRPGEDVAVTIQVNDLQGKPRPAEVSLSAVDESIFSFGEDNLGSIAHMFTTSAEPRRYTQKTWRSSIGRHDDGIHRQQVAMDMAKQQAQAMKAMEKATNGGSPESLMQPRPSVNPLAFILGERPITNLPLARLRTDFRETATWQPQLRAGEDGLIKTTFKLPDSLTAYRLSALALTKQTDIGTGRASLRVSKPLAIQVFVPRFAVEGDRLMAVALIHNKTEADRTVAVEWSVKGADVKSVDDTWSVDRGEGKITLHGTAIVKANASAKLAAWLTMEHVGLASISCSATDAKDADAEERTLNVLPLGVEREYSYNGTLEKPKDIDLPAGFVARDLRISITRTTLGSAMEGLGYLVDYPNGCVEQTMSRFLPAVVVKRASQQISLNLPSDVEEKLPAVLEKGLARLYNFQHADGGWGWWEHDATNDRMTIYVIDGLARCRIAGVAVDLDPLKLGCDYLAAQLENHHLDKSLVPKAWLALALADHVSRPALEAFANDLAEDAPDVACMIALACHEAGLSEAGIHAWAVAKDWQPKTAQDIATKLTAQLAFGDALPACRKTADQLLDLRQGQRWDSTVSTAASIEALASMLHFAPDKSTARRVAITVGGKTILDPHDPQELKSLVQRVHLDSTQLASNDALAIRLLADCDNPVHYAITAAGTQRLDKLEPRGTDVKLRRQFLTLDDKPLAGPVAVGQVIQVRLTLDLQHPLSYLMLNDNRPAGFEFADERLIGADSKSAANIEFRDSSLATFFTNLTAGTHEVTYYLRAETAGTSHVLPAAAFPVYDEKLRGETAADVLEVR